MEKYVCLIRWHDLVDSNHQYEKGDEYPRDGLKPTKKRINDLLSDKNNAKRPVIKAVEVDDS